MYAAKNYYMEELMRVTRYRSSRKDVLEYFGFGTKNMKRFKICPCCGNIQAAKNKFCKVCQTKLPEETVFDIYKAKHRCCTKCENVLPNDAEYCPMCGAKQIHEREAI